MRAQGRQGVVLSWLANLLAGFRLHAADSLAPAKQIQRLPQELCIFAANFPVRDQLALACAANAEAGGLRRA